MGPMTPAPCELSLHADDAPILGQMPQLRIVRHEIGLHKIVSFRKLKMRVVSQPWFLTVRVPPNPQYTNHSDDSLNSYR